MVSYYGLNAASDSIALGLQAITGEALDYANRSVENGRNFFKGASRAKSQEELSALQSRFARGAYEIFVTKMMNINELYADTLREASRGFALQGREPDGR